MYTAFLVMMAVILSSITMVVGFTGARALKRRRLLSARAQRALPLLEDREEFHGWKLEHGAEGIVLEKTLAHGASSSMRVVICTTLATNPRLRVRILREAVPLPEEMLVSIRRLQQRLVMTEEQEPLAHLFSFEPVTLGIRRTRVQVPLDLISHHLGVSAHASIDPRDMRFEPDHALLSSTELALDGDFFGELLDTEVIASLERQLVVYAEMLSIKTDVNMRGFMHDVSNNASTFHGSVNAGIVYGDYLEGEEQLDYWTRCLLQAPGEKRRSKIAFRKLVESGAREQLGAALWNQNLDLHQWFVSNGEAAAMLWTMDSDAQKAKWLDFLFRNAPKLWRVIMDSNAARAYHQDIQKTHKLISNLPVELLTAPYIGAKTRDYIIDFALEHISAFESRDFFVGLAHNLEREALHRFLCRITEPLTEEGAVAIASIMASNLDTPPPIRALIFEKLVSLRTTYKWGFEGFDYLPWLHNTLTSPDPVVRHTALAIARDIGDENTLRVLVELKKEGSARLEPGALDYAIARLYEVHKENLSDNVGKISLAEARGGELTAIEAGTGELSMASPAS